MRLFAKIALITVLFLLIILSITADLPFGQRLRFLLDLGLYLKLISLFGMATLVLFAWGRKCQIEASQKYRRADEVLAQAEAASERKRRQCDKMEQRFKASMAEREQGLDEQIEQVRVEYQQRLNGLKKQNLELKETVARLMSVVKRQNRGPS